LLPYFIPSLHHPVQLTAGEREKYGCEVVFVGHYEADGRERYLRALVEAGVHVKLFGPKYWNRRVLGSLADYFGEVRPALGTDYAKALGGASMCLNFFSRLNRDTINRRCFEVPACGGLLLSERSEDLQAIWRDGEEAVYFSNPEELVERVLWLREHKDEAHQIAQAGRKRILNDEHSVDGRMKTVVEILARTLSKNRAWVRNCSLFD
jgi:spore maturation protein CgeB